jgi:hypothetical protein
VPTIVLAQARELPALTQIGDAKVAALLGLGWTDFKMSSLNRFNRTGTTKEPVKLMGAEREKPICTGGWAGPEKQQPQVGY